MSSKNYDLFGLEFFRSIAQVGFYSMIAHCSLGTADKSGFYI